MTLPELFGLRVGIGLLAGGWLILLMGWRYERRFPGSWLDVYLLSIVAGIIAARAGYVLLNWSDYALHPLRVFDLWYGELIWQGALLGGAALILITCRWRRVPLSAFLDAAALALPVSIMGILWGCRGAGCAEGAALSGADDYPLWLVGYSMGSDGFIAPRYELQLFGIVGCLFLLLLAGMPRQKEARRIWPVLALVGLLLSVLEPVQANASAFDLISALILTLIGGIGWQQSVRRGQNAISTPPPNGL